MKLLKVLLPLLITAPLAASANANPEKAKYFAKECFKTVTYISRLQDGQVVSGRSPAYDGRFSYWDVVSLQNWVSKEWIEGIAIEVNKIEPWGEEVKERFACEITDAFGGGYEVKPIPFNQKGFWNGFTIENFIKRY